MADPPVSIANSKSLPCTDPDTGTTVHDVPVTMLLPDCRSEREKPLPDQLPDSVSFGPVAQASAALAPDHEDAREDDAPFRVHWRTGLDHPARPHNRHIAHRYISRWSAIVDAGIGESLVQRGAGRNRTGE